MRKGIVLAALGLAILLPWAALAQGYHENRELPEGPLGDRIREVLDVVNSGDTERVRAFIENSCTAEFRADTPTDEYVQMIADLYQGSRGLDFYGVREYEGEAPVPGTVVIVRNRLTEAWSAIVLEIEAEPPLSLIHI